MESKIFFYNETEINEKDFKFMMFCNKFFYYRYITILKSVFCIFLLYSAIVLNIHQVDRVVYLFLSIIGIVDTFSIKEARKSRKSVLKYEFFDDCFLVNNSKCIVEIDYDCIKKIVELNNCYYLIIINSIIMLSKNGFKLGNKDDIRKFIEQRKRKTKVEC